MAHAHHHAGHSHGPGHAHAPSPDDDRRWLIAALALILAFMVVEIVVGLLADSLALLSDAAHMLTDAAAIAVAIIAAQLAARPARGRFTFGLGRAEILSAQANGAALLVLAGVLSVEAIRRLGDPPDVEGAFVVVTGLVGALVNVGAAAALGRAQRRSLNVDGAMAHVVTDLYASLAAVASGVLVLVLGFERADPIAALLVAALMIRSGWSLLRDSGLVLLESAPVGMDPQAIGIALAREPGVQEVHDLHVWEVTTGMPMLAAHVLVKPSADCHEVRRRLAHVLRTRHGISHVTLQVDHVRDDHLLEIERGPGVPPG